MNSPTKEYPLYYNYERMSTGLLYQNNTNTNGHLKTAAYLLIQQKTKLSGKLIVFHQVKFHSSPAIHLLNFGCISLPLRVHFCGVCCANNFLRNYNHHYNLCSYGTSLQTYSQNLLFHGFKSYALNFSFRHVMHILI